MPTWQKTTKDTFTGFCDDPLQPHQYIWIGTTNGLRRMEKKTGICRTFTTKDGLPDNMIFNLLKDDNHDLWFNTNSGLTRLHPAGTSFRNFDVSDGLPSREFNDNTSTKLKDGTLVFAGVNGLIYFNPNDIMTLPPLRTVLTDFEVSGKIFCCCHRSQGKENQTSFSKRLLSRQ